MNHDNEPAAEVVGEQLLAARSRRLNGALYDTGLLAVVGPDWLTPVTDGITFSALYGRQAEQLLLHLEGLAGGRRGRSLRPTAGQLRLPHVDNHLTLVGQTSATGGVR